MNYGINAWQGTRSVDCVDETSIPLTLKHQGGGYFTCFSLDANFRFAIAPNELSHTIKNGTAPGHKCAVIERTR